LRARRIGPLVVLACLMIAGRPDAARAQATTDPRNLRYSDLVPAANLDSVPFLNWWTVWALLDMWDGPREGTLGQVPWLAASGLLRSYGIDARMPTSEAEVQFVRITARHFRERQLVLKGEDTTRIHAFAFVRGNAREVELSARTYDRATGALARTPGHLFIRCDHQDRDRFLAELSSSDAADRPFESAAPGSLLHWAGWTGCRIGQWWDRWMVPIRDAGPR